MKKIFTRFAVVLVIVSSLSVPVLAVSLPETTPAAASTPGVPPSQEEIKSAVKEFKSISRKERKSKIKEAKKLFKQYRAEKKAQRDAEADIVLLAILAILLPPLAVYLHQGEINSLFWISLILTLLFWIPGVIFAFLVIFDAI